MTLLEDRLFNEEMLVSFERNDCILPLLKESPKEASRFVTHQWLESSLPKRLIFCHVYQDILRGHLRDRSILDIGGGYSAVTDSLVQQCRYSLVDLMAHDGLPAVHAREKALGLNFWAAEDWYTYTPPGPVDLVIANDLFPNVDQRLEAFLDKYLPLCGELRVTLTFYDQFRYYKVKRVDADEVFHVVPWDRFQTQRVLTKYQDRLLDSFKEVPNSLRRFATGERFQSLFPNQRLVAYCRLKGGA